MTISEGIKESIKDAEEALNKQFPKDAPFKVDEVSIVLQMRAISAKSESVVLNVNSVAIVGANTDSERIIKAKKETRPAPPPAVPLKAVPGGKPNPDGSKDETPKPEAEKK